MAVIVTPVSCLQSTIKAKLTDGRVIMIQYARSMLFAVVLSVAGRVSMPVVRHNATLQQQSSHASISVKLSARPDSRHVLVDLLFTNQSSSDAYLEKSNACSNGIIENNVFIVTSGRQQLDYAGVLMKRGRPRPQDYILLGPGKSFSTQVDLAPAYAFLDGVHTYQVKYSALHTFPDRDGFIDVESNVERFHFRR
jgi:hypothetical protein